MTNKRMNEAQGTQLGKTQDVLTLTLNGKRTIGETDFYRLTIDCVHIVNRRTGRAYPASYQQANERAAELLQVQPAKLTIQAGEMDNSPLKREYSKLTTPGKHVTTGRRQTDPNAPIPVATRKLVSRY